MDPLFAWYLALGAGIAAMSVSARLRANGLARALSRAGFEVRRRVGGELRAEGAPLGVPVVVDLRRIEVAGRSSPSRWMLEMRATARTSLRWSAGAFVAAPGLIDGRPRDAATWRALSPWWPVQAVLRAEDGVLELSGELNITSVSAMPVVEALARAARALDGDAADLLARLAENAGSAKLADAAGAADALFTWFPGSEEARALAARTAYSPHPWLRWLAARWAGNETVEVLAAVALAGDVPHDVRISALRQHAKRATPEEVIGLCGPMLAFGNDLTEIAFELLAATRGATAVLSRAANASLPRQRAVPLTHAIARSPEVATCPEAQPALLRLLEHQHPEVVEAASDALARYGTRDAVEALRGRIRRGDLHRSLEKSLELTIELIQSRQRGAEVGQLSIAGAADAEGAVSVAPSAGEVAISSEEPG